MMPANVEAAFRAVLQDQSRLRAVTAGLESTRSRDELGAIVRAQLEHPDELMSSVADQLRVAVPVSGRVTPSTLGGALLAAHGAVAGQLRSLEAACRWCLEPELAHLATGLLAEHGTLAAGFVRLIARETASPPGAPAHA